MFGLGCFWGAERLFWEPPGVYSTAVGYAGGIARIRLQGVCAGRTGHAEVVLVFYDPNQISYGELLKVFWETHDPTQGMRQGNDIGTQYRSAIFCYEMRSAAAAESCARSTRRCSGRARVHHHGDRTVAAFYYAEDYHQQYLAKNPGGYCGIGGCGVPFKFAELPVGEKA